MDLPQRIDDCYGDRTHILPPPERQSQTIQGPSKERPEALHWRGRYAHRVGSPFECGRACHRNFARRWPEASRGLLYRVFHVLILLLRVDGTSPAVQAAALMIGIWALISFK